MLFSDRRPDVEGDKVLREFDAKVEAAGAGEEEEDVDEELQIEERGGDIAPNAACPITGIGVRSSRLFFVLDLRPSTLPELFVLTTTGSIERTGGIAPDVACPITGVGVRHSTVGRPLHFPCIAEVFRPDGDLMELRQ